MVLNFKDEYGNQAVDVNQLLDYFDGNAVVSGCEPTAGGGSFDIDVAAGTVIVSGSEVSVSSDTVTVSTPDASNPRKDLIYVDGTGSVKIIEGTAEEAAPSSNSKFKTFQPTPDDFDDKTGAVIAEVWVPAGASGINADDIRDRRLLSTLTVADLSVTNSIDVGSNKITSVTDPTAAQDAATKNYVDSVAGGPTIEDDGTSIVSAADLIDFAGTDFDVTNPTGDDAQVVLSTDSVDTDEIDLSISPTWTGTHTFDAQIDLTPIAEPAHAEGRIWYDSSEKALSYHNDESEVTMSLGREEWARVRNESGSTITNGSVVRVTGAHSGSGLPTVGLAQADTADNADVFGVATHDIENNSEGYITTYGLVRNLDTSAYTAGDILYLDPNNAGQFVTTEPDSPAFSVEIGVVTKANASDGRIHIATGQARAGIYTEGGIPFANSSGVLIEDAANLYWDNSSNELGIGTNTPGATLDVAGDVQLTGDLTDGTVTIFDGTNNYVPTAALQDSSVTVAGNSVSLGGSTAVAVSDLSDAAVSSPSAGDFIIYNATAGDFENATITAGEALTGTTGDASYTLDVDIGGQTSVTAAASDEVLIEDASDSANKKKVTAQSIADLGSGGSAIVLDLGDDDSNESTDLSEIATTNDTNSIFTEPTADKLLIDVSQNWPTADDVPDSAVDHDATTNFVANEHVDHSTVSITAGDALTGGGDLTTTRTLDVDINGATDLASPATGDEMLLADVSATNAIVKSDVGTVLSLYDSLTATLTNKTIDADGTGNTITNIGADETKLGDGLEGDGSDNIKTEEPFVFSTGMTNWADGLTDEEIDRIQLQTGETLVIDRIEFRQKGGGTSASADVDVHDSTAASTIGTQTLGGTTKDAGSSGSGNLVQIRLTNGTGAAIDASVRVHGRIQGA